MECLQKRLLPGWRAAPLPRLPGPLSCRQAAEQRGRAGLRAASGGGRRRAAVPPARSATAPELDVAARWEGSGEFKVIPSVPALLGKAGLLPAEVRKCPCPLPALPRLRVIWSIVNRTLRSGFEEKTCYPRHFEICLGQSCISAKGNFPWING